MLECVWRVIPALLLVSVLQGCASIVGGSTQVVSVDTPGCPGARCELVNEKGRFFVPATPGTVSVHRSYNNLQVTCSKEGAASTPISVASSTKAMAFGNILFGGVIGAGVDIGTGAAYDYPQLITVAMDCSAPPGGSTASATKPPVRIGLRVEPAEGGVLVVAVEPGSPAAAAGFVVGDLVVSVDGHSVAEPSALAAHVGHPAAAHEFVVRREGREWTMRIGPLPAASASGTETR